MSDRNNKLGDSNINRKDFFKLVGGALGLGVLSYYLGLRDQPKPSSPDANAPSYIDGGIGLPVFRGPYLQKDAQLAAFLFTTDLSALTALCDQTLNALEASPFKYVPLMSDVLLVYADMLVSSLEERDAQVGLIPETEVSFWILTVAMQKTSSGYVAHHLAWFLPYLLVDEGSSIATGREVYGFNKQAAEFNKPQEIQSPQFTTDVLGFIQFNPAAVARKERLLELNSSSAETSQSTWNDWNFAKNTLSNALLTNVRSDLGPNIMEFATRAAIDHIPLAFLKQFRHAANTRIACYQTIVEASLQVKEFYGGGLFVYPHILKINPLDSHPLARKLGLKQEQASKFGAWLKVDFILSEGNEFE